MGSPTNFSDDEYFGYNEERCLAERNGGHLSGSDIMYLDGKYGHRFSNYSDDEDSFFPDFDEFHSITAASDEDQSLQLKEKLKDLKKERKALYKRLRAIKREMQDIQQLLPKESKEK